MTCLERNTLNPSITIDWFCENVSDHMVSVAVLSCYMIVDYLLTYKVILDVYMLRSLTSLGLLAMLIADRLLVECDRRRWSTIYIFIELTKPSSFLISFIC